MAQSAMISMRMNADLKKQGDQILAKMGLSPSNFVSMAYSQLVMQRRVPFDTKVAEEPKQHVLPDENTMTQEEINAAIDEGYRDMLAGRVRPAREVFAELEAKYGF